VRHAWTPFTGTDRGLVLEFGPAEDVVLERALMHMRCAAAWIRARVELNLTSTAD